MSKEYPTFGKYPRVFWSGLQIVRGFISRLANLVSVTQQDMFDAGIVLRRTRD